MPESPQPTDSRARDRAALAKLEARLAAAEELQAMMKVANGIVRDPQLSQAEKVVRLARDCGVMQWSARELLTPDSAGRVGFPEYRLVNNGASIRRMRQRLRALSEGDGGCSVTLVFPGGRVEDNAEDCRVRIFHDVKPPEGTIAKLRAYGFHWTPSLVCWQRLRNDSARYAAAQITGVRWPEMAPVVKGPSVATANPVAVTQGVRTGDRA